MLLRHVLNNINTAKSATDISHSVSVVDACLRLAASMSEVGKFYSRKVFFRSCGLICVPTDTMDDRPTDDEDNLTVSELLRLAKERNVSHYQNY